MSSSSLFEAVNCCQSLRRTKDSSQKLRMTENIMKNMNAEVLKNTNMERFDLKQAVENARMQVSTEELEVQEAQEEARSLELELQEAQLAHERKEEAERQGKETAEKIGEVTG